MTSGLWPPLNRQNFGRQVPACICCATREECSSIRVKVLMTSFRMISDGDVKGPRQSRDPKTTRNKGDWQHFMIQKWSADKLWNTKCIEIACPTMAGFNKYKYKLLAGVCRQIWHNLGSGQVTLLTIAPRSMVQHTYPISAGVKADISSAEHLNECLWVDQA